MNYHRQTEFHERFNSVCSIEGDAGEPGPGGGEGGGGGGESVSAGEGSPGSSPAPSGFGGASAADADHRFPATPPPTATETQRVYDLMQLDPNQSISMDDMKVLLGFNPPLKKAEEPKQAVQQPAQPQQQEQQQQQQQPSEQQAQQPQLDPSVKALVEALEKATNTPAPAQPQQPQQGTQPQAPKPFYGGVRPAMQVNPQLAAEIFQADDPQKSSAALNSLISGVMNHVMQDVLAVAQTLQRNIVSQVPQYVAAQQDSRSNAEKFYSKYPELNKGPFQGATQYFAQQLAQKRQQAGQPVTYDDAFITEIGEAVHGYIKNTLGFDVPRAGTQVQQVVPAQRQQHQQQPVVQQAPAAKPNGSAGQPWMTPGNTRPPAGSGNDKSAELLNLVL